MNLFTHKALKYLSGRVLGFILRVTYPSNVNLGTMGKISFKARVLFDKKAQILIGNSFNLSRFTELQSRGRLVIGDNFTLNEYSRVIALGEIKIGSNVTIARFVSILDHDHLYDELKNRIANDYLIENISIGSNVWIGDKVTILKGVSIGDNVIVGANSVVVNDVSSGAIVAGIPARVIKKRL
jgi:acetyltransferase-like isoleucine patch superfamily enzyme